MSGRYSPVAVNQAIEASNRAGRRIGGREARMIHALLKGRQDPDRDRLELELRAKAPKRARVDQADAGHLPLFIAGNEPGFF